MRKIKTYAEKLRDPRWQRVRQKVLDRWKHTCSECRTKEKTLQVHHRFYETGKEPWDYDLNDLIVLCKQCHLKRHAVELRIQKHIGRLAYSNLCKLSANLENGIPFEKTKKKKDEQQQDDPIFNQKENAMFNALKDSLDI